MRAGRAARTARSRPSSALLRALRSPRCEREQQEEEPEAAVPARGRLRGEPFTRVDVERALLAPGTDVVRHGRPSVAVASKPALPAKEEQLSDGGHDDEAPRPPVAEAPRQLRDVTEVLAVQADDEGGDEEERRDHRQALHHLVLIVRDLALKVVANAGERVA